MKSSYEVRAQKFIMKIAPYVQNCEEIEDYENALREVCNAMPKRKILCSSGCARTAFITSDYVVKMEHGQDDVEYYGGGRNEMALYAEAEEDGMEYLFAKITPFEYEGRTYYIMPRVKGIDFYRGRHAWDYMTKKESDWCKKHELSDLHAGNYGFRNHHVCIIDYGCVD